MNTSPTFPTVEEQMSWLRFKVKTNRFAKPPAPGKRDIRRHDQLAVDLKGAQEAGHYFVLRSHSTNKDRLVYWPEGLHAMQLVASGEHILGRVVQTSREM